MKSLPHIFLILLFAVAPDATAQVAVVTEVSGRVVLADNGSTSFDTDVAFGMSVEEGDQIRTGPDGSATLLFENGDVFVVRAGRIVRVGDNEISVSNSDQSGSSERLGTVGPASSALALHRSGDGEIAALSGLRAGLGAKPLQAVYPHNSVIKESNPTFEWSSDTSFEFYQIRIFESTGTVFEAEVEGTEWVYPENAPALTPGRDYLWIVTGVDMLDEVESSPTSFQIISSDSRAALVEEESRIAQLGLEPSGSSVFLMKGLVYRELGLNHDALLQFQSLLDKYPDSRKARELLADTWAVLGHYDRASQLLTQ